MGSIRVLIADDHPATAETVRDLLDLEFDVVEVVSNGEALVVAARLHSPDVIVSDIAMPRQNGIQAAGEILRQNQEARIVLMTMYDDPEFVDEGLSCGVLGYVMKAMAAEELPFAVREAFAGRHYMSPRIRH